MANGAINPQQENYENVLPSIDPQGPHNQIPQTFYDTLPKRNKIFEQILHLPRHKLNGENTWNESRVNAR